MVWALISRVHEDISIWINILFDILLFYFIKIINLMTVILSL
jgi:hypothetical protein